MPIPLLAMLGMGGAAGAGAGGMGAGLAGLLGKGGGMSAPAMGSAGNAGQIFGGAQAPFGSMDFSGVGSQMAAPGTPGSVGGAPALQPSGAASGGGGGDFWGQFTQMLKGPGGAANKVDMAGTLMAGQGDAERRLSSTFRGPTMPFLPHLNTNQVGPNQNPGQIGLAQLLQQMAQRRG